MVFKVFSIFNLFFWLALLLLSPLTHTHMRTHTHTHTTQHTHTPHTHNTHVLSLISVLIIFRAQGFCLISDSPWFSVILRVHAGYFRGNRMTQLFTFSYTQKRVCGEPDRCSVGYISQWHVMWGRINREHLALLMFHLKPSNLCCNIFYLYIHIIHMYTYLKFKNTVEYNL